MHSQNFSCCHFKVCSGCSVDLSLPFPPVWQDILDYAKDFSLSPVLHQGPAIHWRCRAKLAVRGTAQQPLIGLFRQHSHDVVPIPLCLVHHPKINMAINSLERWMRRHHLAPYQEKTGEGHLRYVQCVVERSTGKVQVAFILNFKDFSSKIAKQWHDLLLQLFQEDREGLWHSIWVNFNDQATNTIFGKEWVHVAGEAFLWETFGHIHVCYQPANFAQANLNLFEDMLKHIRDAIPDEAKVVEYYAGVGVIGLFIASKCQWVKCEEINPHAELCFRLAKDKLPPDVFAKLSFYTGSAEEALFLMDEADVAIVDPPRKGLSKVFIEALNRSSVAKLIYVSCGWEAFKQDCQRLLLDGWQLKKLEGYAFFPGSNHVELVAEFNS